VTLLPERSVTARTDHRTSQVVLYQMTNCSITEVLPQQMFCHKKTF